MKAGSAFTSYWGDADVGWYDALSGPATFKVCSDSLFAMTKDSGQAFLAVRAGSHSQLDDHGRRRSHLFRRVAKPGDQAIAIPPDRRAGTLGRSIPRHARSPDRRDDLGTADRHSRWNGRLLSGGRRRHARGQCLHGRESSKSRRFRQADGKQTWTQSFGWFENKGDHGKAISRPAIVGGRVYVRPKVLDLASGEILGIEMPKGKCGTYAATTNALVFRTTEITLWNKLSGSASSWDRMRPDCWLSTIPAAGMLLSPEGGGGCSCGSWMEMSVGFMPRSD